MQKGDKLKRQRLLICLISILFVVFCGALTVSLAIFRFEDGDLQQNSFGAVVLHDNSQYKYKSKIQNQLDGEQYLFNDIKLTVADNTSPVYIRAHVFFDSTNEVAKDKIKFNSFSIKNHEDYTWSRFGDYWYLCDNSGNLLSLNSTKAGEVYVFLTQSDAIVPSMSGVLGEGEFVSCEIVLQSSLASNFSNTTDFAQINNSFDKDAEEKTKTGKFVVEFKQNGVTLSTQTINYGGSSTIPEVTTATGKVLSCWNTREDGTGADVTNEQLNYITQDLTLFPRFETQKVLVTVVQGEGGKISPETQMVDWGSDLVLSFVSDKNYMLKQIFVNGNPVGASKEYLLKKITGATTISAEFVRDFVVLDINNGSGSQPDVIYNADNSKFMLQGDEPTQSGGKEFYYYSTNSADNEQGQNGTRYDLGCWYDVPNATGSTTLYAIYLTPTQNYQTAQSFIVIPKNVVQISNSTKNIFGAANNVVKFVTLPRTTTKIGTYAFADCVGLVGVSMSDNVLSIGSCAFSGNKSLATFRAPSSLENIGDSAFADCVGLATVQNLQNTKLVEISRECFINCSNLTDITLPSTITKISGYAFAKSGLKTINLEDASLDILAEYAFYSCTNLLSVTVPETLETLGEFVFGYSGITEINNFLSTYVMSISPYAFSGTKIKQIDLSPYANEIGYRAFAECEELVRVGIRNSGVAKIAEQAFDSCTKLQNMIFPTSLGELGAFAFSKCSSLSSVSFNAALTKIGEFCFAGCTSLTQILGFEKSSVNEIGANAFDGCTLLSSLSFPTSIHTIDEYAFAECTGLLSIDFSIDLSSLGFSDPPTIAATAFAGTKSSMKVVVLEKCFDSYRDFLADKGFADDTCMYIYNDISKKAYYKDNKWVLYHDATITSSCGEGGTITPLGETVFSLGMSPQYIITPNLGYKISTILVNGEEISITAADGLSQNYIFDNIQDEYSTIHATFAKRVFQIQSECGDGGTITPGAGTFTYEYGENVTFNFVPEQAYKIKSVVVDGKSNQKALDEASYTFVNIHSDHTISVLFELKTYTISISCGEGGTVYPATSFVAKWGETHSISYSPNADRYVTSLIVDGVAISLAGVDRTAPQTYTFEEIKDNHTINCLFDSTKKTLDYDTQGGVFDDGTTSKTQQYDVYSADYIKLVSQPTRTGYTFVGWNTKADGTGTYIYGGENYYDTFRRRDGTLYAIWNVLKYTINATAGANGKISPEGEIEVDYGTSLTFEMTPNVGYKITEIKIDGSYLSFATQDGDRYNYTFNNISGNHTIQVNFEERIFVVTADANGGVVTGTAWDVSSDGKTATKQVAFNSAYGTLPTATRTGYTFVGWFTDKNGGTQIAESTKITTAKDSLLFAHWTPITYTVQYNGNGATSGTTPSSTHIYDKAKALTANGFEKSGYSFVRWENEDRTKTFDDQQVVTNLSSTQGAIVTLNAVWTEKWVMIKFDANGGSVSQPSKNVRFNSTYGELPTATRTGYTFDGWWTEKNGGTQISAGTKMTTSDDHILYAKWAPITYTVKYDGNGETSGSTASSTHTYDVSKALTINKFSRIGYTFAGWAKTESGSAVHEDGESVKNLASIQGAVVTLYAKWTPITYTVQYDGNEASGSTASSTHTYDVPKSLTANGFTRTGYTFAGWARSRTGSVVYNDKETVTNLASTQDYVFNLYAQWTPITYTVHYDGNKKTGGLTASSTHTYGVSKTLTANGFTKTGYSFAAWNTEVDGSGTAYVDGASVKNLASTQGAVVTLYAQWTPNIYSVTLDPNAEDASVVPTSISVAYDRAYGTLPTPTRDEFGFGGWWTEKNGGTRVTETTTVKITKDQILYAHWILLDSVLYKNWKNVIKAQGYDVSKITSISFAVSEPETGTKIKVGANDQSGTTLWNKSSSFANAYAFVSQDSSGNISVVFYAKSLLQTPTDSTSLFGDLTGLTSIEFNDLIDTSNTTNFTGFIKGSDALTHIDLDYISFYSANVVDDIFAAKSLRKITNLGNYSHDDIDIPLPWSVWYDDDDKLSSGYQVFNSRMEISTLHRSFTVNFAAVAKNYEGKTADERENDLRESVKNNQSIAFSGGSFDSGDTNLADALISQYSGLSTPAAVNYMQIFPYDSSMWTKIADSKTILSKPIYVLGNSQWYVSVPRHYEFEIECYDGAGNSLSVLYYGWSAEELADPDISGEFAYRESIVFPTATRYIQIAVWTNDVNSKGEQKDISTSVVMNSAFREGRLTLESSSITNIWDGNPIPMPVCYVQGMEYVDSTYDSTGNGFVAERGEEDGNFKNRYFFVTMEKGQYITHVQTFVPITQTVTLNPNGGTYDKKDGKTEKITWTGYVGTEITIYKNKFSKTGYSLQSITNSAKGSFRDSGAGSSYWTNNTEYVFVVGASSTTLKVKWTAITYTVRYNGNKATSGSTASSTHTYDKASALTANGFARTGYTFAGWNTKADGSGTAYSDKASVKNLASTQGYVFNLYAQWKPITYTVRYNGNGATSGSTGDSSHTYNVTKALTANGFTRYGYTFAGWAKTASGSVVYPNKTNVINLTTVKDDTVTLYAVWTANIHKITFNKNGGTGGTDAIWFRYGTQKFYSDSTCSTELENQKISLPTKTGYTFAYYSHPSWHTNFESDGSYYYEDEQDNVINYDEDFTFDISWNIKTYTVTINSSIVGTYAISGGQSGSIAIGDTLTFELTYGTQITFTKRCRGGTTLGNKTTYQTLKVNDQESANISNSIKEVSVTITVSDGYETLNVSGGTYVTGAIIGG